MRLKQVVYALDRQGEKEIRGLHARLKREGIFCGSLEQWERDVKGCRRGEKKINRDNLRNYILFITGLSETLKRSFRGGLRRDWFLPHLGGLFSRSCLCAPEF